MANTVLRGAANTVLRGGANTVLRGGPNTVLRGGPLRGGPTIILNGGLFRIFNPLIGAPINYLPVNISLKKSNVWLNGILCIKENPYYRITATRNNLVEIRKDGDEHILVINDQVIYDTKTEFNYTVHVKLNPHITDKPYADFFQYY